MILAGTALIVFGLLALCLGRAIRQRDEERHRRINAETASAIWHEVATGHAQPICGDGRKVRDGRTN